MFCALLRDRVAFERHAPHGRTGFEQPGKHLRGLVAKRGRGYVAVPRSWGGVIEGHIEKLYAGVASERFAEGDKLHVADAAVEEVLAVPVQAQDTCPARCWATRGSVLGALIGATHAGCTAAPATRGSGYHDVMSRYGS